MNNEDNKVENTSPLQQVVSSSEVNAQNNTLERIEDTAQILKQKYVNPEKKNTLLSDSDLLYNFMGKNYQKFVMKAFNFPALIFSFLYLLFRKMYFYSFIVMVIYFLISIFIKDPYYVYGAVILINIVLFFATNKLYIRYSRTKIDSIRYKNSSYNNELILAECKKKGGTSILSVLFGLIINILVILIFVVGYFYFIGKVPINDIYNKVIDLYNKDKWELTMSKSFEFFDENIIESFNKAADDYKETKLEPIAYFGRQIVSGTNHMFLCKSGYYYKVAVLYMDLGGKATITHVSDFDILNYTNKNIDIKNEELDGGWIVEIPGKAVVLEEDVEKAFSKVQEKLVGVTYYPIMVFENQDNYAIMCYGRLSDRNDTTNVYVMTISKNGELISMAGIDLGEFNK